MAKEKNAYIPNLEGQVNLTVHPPGVQEAYRPLKDWHTTPVGMALTTVGTEFCLKRSGLRYRIDSVKTKKDKNGRAYVVANVIRVSDGHKSPHIHPDHPKYLEPNYVTIFYDASRKTEAAVEETADPINESPVEAANENEAVPETTNGETNEAENEA